MLRRWSQMFGYRHSIVLLGFLGNFVSYTMRLTINMAIVQMTAGNSSKGNGTNETAVTDCPRPTNNDEGDEEATQNSEVFDWDAQLQGEILGAFYYGYLFTQIPSGYLAGFYGAKMLYGVGIGATAFFTLLGPAAARHSAHSLIVVRVLMGLAQGISFPLLSSIFGRWAPPAERTKLLAITGAGTQFGTVIAFPVLGLVGATYGWPSMFYVFGTIGFLFLIPWYLFAYDSPEQHRHISGEEKSYIISSIGAPAMGAQSPRIPWRRIVLSLPFWSLLISCWCSDWGFYTLLSDVPLYLEGNLGYTLKQNANFSGIPYLVMWAVIMIFSPVADHVILKNYVSVTAERKIATVLGTLIPGILLIGIPLSGCSQESVLALLALSTGFTGFASLGFRVSFNDISPSHAGLLYAVCNTFATISGFVGPAVTGILTEGPNGHNTAHWQNVFYIAAAFYFIGAIVFVMFGTGEQQNWDNQEKSFNNRIAPEAVTAADGVAILQPGRKSSIPPWIPPSQDAVLMEGTVQEQQKRRRTSLVPPGLEAVGSGTNSHSMAPATRSTFAVRIPETVPEESIGPPIQPVTAPFMTSDQKSGAPEKAVSAVSGVSGIPNRVSSIISSKSGAPVRVDSLLPRPAGLEGI